MNLESAKVAQILIPVYEFDSSVAFCRDVLCWRLTQRTTAASNVARAIWES